MTEQLPSPFRHDAISPTLQLFAGRLIKATQLTEQAFLQVGRQVAEGHRQARALAELSGHALRFDKGETAEAMVARLQLLTERSAMWLVEAHRQSRTICVSLGTLEHDVAAMSLPLRGLAKVVKTLQALRVATLIETARSQGQGAVVLGQELHHLGSLMREKLNQINGRCEMLNTLRQRAAGLEEEAQAGPLKAAESEISHARRLLGSLAARYARSADQGARLQQCSAELAENFGELVAALQFQDITRQRLQHIHEALDALGAALADEAATGAAVAEVCRLQHEQLHLAVSEFCGALDRLDENLLGMAVSIEVLADAAGSTFLIDHDAGCAGVAPALQAVTLCLENVQTTHLAAGQAIFAVCQAVRDVAALAGEIEQLGEEMQLLAQNAAVSAAHGSGQAVGLTVIAGNIQLLAEEAGHLAVVLADGCRQVSEQAEELDGRDQQSGNREAHLEALLDEARALTERLAAGRQELDGRVATIGRQAVEIGSGLQAARAGAGIRRQFLAEVEPVLEGLCRMVMEQGPVTAAGDHRMLDTLQKHYTMMSERDVHQRFLQQQAVQYPEGERSAPVSPVHNFGDNVDLF